MKKRYKYQKYQTKMQLNEMLHIAAGCFIRLGKLQLEVFFQMLYHAITNEDDQ